LSTITLPPVALMCSESPLTALADVVKINSAKAVSGDSLHIKATGGNVMVDKARVTKTDIIASNGVIHVIDSVLLPPGE